MAEMVKLTIDGREIEVEPGTLIIEAARRLAIDIPTFCYDERLRSVGACRMCLVEVEKSPKLIASCATPVAPGMVVKTDSKRVVEARKAVLEFLLINHPLDCPTCDKGGECPLQNLTYSYGPPTSRFGEDKIRFQEGTSLKFDDVRIGPEIWLNRNRCIICFKCVRIAREIAGGEDLGMFHRGAYARIDIPSGIEYANEFSGNTVEYCPVGALMSDSFRYKIRTWLLERSPSICWLCSDGCNITVESNKGKIYRHQSRRNDRIDRGFLCDRGRYGFDIPNHSERIRLPAVVKNGRPQVISYEEMLAMVIHRMKEQKGSEAALLLDTSITNEDAFCAAEFFREKFPGSSIAVASRHNLSTANSPLSLGLSVTMDEFQTADVVLMVDCDISVEHPILGLRLRKIISLGGRLYSIHHRPISLGRFDFSHIKVPFGNEHKAIDQIRGLLSGQPASLMAEASTNELQKDIKRAKNIHIIVGADFFNNPNSGLLRNSIIDLAADIKAKVSYLPDETNYIGVCLSAEPNCSFEQLVARLAEGKIKTLFIAGGNPVDIYPDRKLIFSALRNSEYTIYWSAFTDATAELSTMIIPRALPPESAGSLLNIERRLQFLTPAYRPAREINSLIRLFTELKIELGGRPYYSAAEVFEEMKRKLPAFGSFSYGVSDNPPIALSGELNVPVMTEMKTTPPADYPFILGFAPGFYYGASGLTSCSNTLNKLAGNPHLLINAEDARKMGVADGHRIKLITAAGEGVFEGRLSDSLNHGELVLSGFSITSPPNVFMSGWNMPVYAAIEKV